MDGGVAKHRVERRGAEGADSETTSGHVHCDAVEDEVAVGLDEHASGVVRMDRDVSTRDMDGRTRCPCRAHADTDAGVDVDVRISNRHRVEAITCAVLTDPLTGTIDGDG